MNLEINPVSKESLQAREIALAAYLKKHGLINSSDLKLERLTGGQSNPTYRVKTGGRDYVVRTKPSGVLLASAHAIDREFRVMQALKNSAVPVPKVHIFCDDPTVIGAQFYVMDFMDGRVFTDQSLPDVSPTDRATIYGEMLRAISTLHAVDYETLELGTFGRTGSYFSRQIARWSRQYRDSSTKQIPSMDALIEWLPKHIPGDEETTLVHGDYRMDNLIFDPVEPRIIGILDWELSTLGHPLADFSYLCMSWHIPATLWRGIGGLDLKTLNIPSEASFVDSYCAATGRDAQKHWNFYMAYNLFRISSILQGIAKRSQEGNAVGTDSEQVGGKAEPLANLAWSFAQLC